MEPIYVSLDDKFDSKSVVVEVPKTRKFTRGKSSIEYTTSDVYVEEENGAQLPISFELAEQNMWGVNGIYPFGLSKDKQADNKLEGFQVVIR